MSTQPVVIAYPGEGFGGEIKTMKVATARIRAQLAYELLTEIVERAEPGPPSPLVDEVAAALQALERIPEIRLQPADVTPSITLGRLHACRKLVHATKQLAKPAKGEALSRWLEGVLVLIDGIASLMKASEADYLTKIKQLQSKLHADLERLI